MRRVQRRTPASTIPVILGENFDANRNAVEIVRNIAQAIGAKPSQVALA
jgi:aryl-alcohol dehydrogenase-like predicted oxidoreductase